MKREPTVLVVGGYGTFGGRIVELLESEPRLTLAVAGRSIARATAFCAGRSQAKARLVPWAFDRRGDLDAQLAAVRPDILVDASGPFQSYGNGRYDLIRSCLALGVNYLDLADGSDFVAGVSAFDAAARDAGVFVLSGVSSSGIGRWGNAAADGVAEGSMSGSADRANAATCGFRPEDADVAFGAEVPRDALSLAAEVEAVEPVGAESFLYCGAASTRVVVRVGGRALAKPGDKLRIVVKADKLHWFDAAGKRTSLG